MLEVADPVILLLSECLELVLNSADGKKSVGINWFVDCRPDDRLFIPSARQVERFIERLVTNRWISWASLYRQGYESIELDNLPREVDLAEWREYQLVLSGDIDEVDLPAITCDDMQADHGGQTIIVEVYQEPAPRRFFNVACASISDGYIWERDKPQFRCNSCGANLLYETSPCHRVYERIMRCCPACSLPTDFTKYPVKIGNADGALITTALPFVSTFSVSIDVEHLSNEIEDGKQVRITPHFRAALEDCFERRFLNHMVAS